MDNYRNYCLLRDAIVIDAVRDLQLAYRELDKAADNEMVVNNRRNNVEREERFFKSKWFHELTGLDGNKAMKSLYERRWEPVPNAITKRAMD